MLTAKNLTPALLIALLVPACLAPGDDGRHGGPTGGGSGSSGGGGSTGDDQGDVGDDLRQACNSDTECSNDLCIEGFGCSHRCDIGVANPCRDAQAWCVPLTDGSFGCYGDLASDFDTGDDGVQPPDSYATGTLTVGDQDVFTLDFSQGTGDWFFTLETIGDDFLNYALDFYWWDGSYMGTLDGDFAPHDFEAGWINIADRAHQYTHFFAVVRNTGTDPGRYIFHYERCINGCCGADC